MIQFNRDSLPSLRSIIISKECFGTLKIYLIFNKKTKYFNKKISLQELDSYVNFDIKARSQQHRKAAFS